MGVTSVIVQKRQTDSYRRPCLMDTCLGTIVWKCGFCQVALPTVQVHETCKQCGAVIVEMSGGPDV